MPVPISAFTFYLVFFLGDVVLLCVLFIIFGPPVHITRWGHMAVMPWIKVTWYGRWRHMNMVNMDHDSSFQWHFISLLQLYHHRIATITYPLNIMSFSITFYKLIDTFCFLISVGEINWEELFPSQVSAGSVQVIRPGVRFTQPQEYLWCRESRSSKGVHVFWLQSTTIRESEYPFTMNTFSTCR